MGPLKVMIDRKAAVAAYAAKVIEPEKMSAIDKIVLRLPFVPRDGTSCLICMAMSLVVCFVVVLVISQFDREQAASKEEHDEHEETQQQEVVGKFMGENINAKEAEQDDTDQDESKPFEEPPTPTLSPPDDIVDVKGEKSVPSIPIPKSPSKMLREKAKSIGGSIRRLGSNDYASKLSIIKKKE